MHGSSRQRTVLLRGLARDCSSICWPEVNRLQAPAVAFAAAATAAAGDHCWVELRSAAWRQEALRPGRLWDWHTRPGVSLEGRHLDPADAAWHAQRLLRHLLLLGAGQMHDCSTGVKRGWRRALIGIPEVEETQVGRKLPSWAGQRVGNGWNLRGRTACPGIVSTLMFVVASSLVLQAAASTVAPAGTQPHARCTQLLRWGLSSSTAMVRRSKTTGLHADRR